MHEGGGPCHRACDLGVHAILRALCNSARSVHSADLLCEPSEDSAQSLSARVTDLHGVSGAHARHARSMCHTEHQARASQTYRQRVQPPQARLPTGSIPRQSAVAARQSAPLVGSDPTERQTRTAPSGLAPRSTAGYRTDSQKTRQCACPRCRSHVSRVGEPSDFQTAG